MSISRFAGLYNANEYAYGIQPQTGPLVVGLGTTVTGSGTLTLNEGYTNLTDGTYLNPLNVNAPVLVGSGTTAETVTPTAVNNPTPTVYQTAQFTATFSNTHGAGENVASGTYGLQEALNAAGGAGGGTVIVDATWALRGGTNAMIAAATIPAGVAIFDNRSGSGFGTVTANLTNTQVKATNSAPPTILFAPGATNMWDVVDCWLENVSGGAAYANGGALGLYYGTSSSGTICTGTIAATFLTSPTTKQLAKILGIAQTTIATTSILNQPVVLANPTADFITGTGTMIVKANARLLTNLS